MIDGHNVLGVILARRYGETVSWLRRIAKRKPGLFPHWEAGFLP